MYSYMLLDKIFECCHWEREDMLCFLLWWQQVSCAHFHGICIMNQWLACTAHVGVLPFRAELFKVEGSCFIQAPNKTFLQVNCIRKTKSFFAVEECLEHSLKAGYISPLTPLNISSNIKHTTNISSFSLLVPSLSLVSHMLLVKPLGFYLHHCFHNE